MYQYSASFRQLLIFQKETLLKLLSAAAQPKSLHMLLACPLPISLLLKAEAVWEVLLSPPAPWCTCKVPICYMLLA